MAKKGRGNRIFVGVVVVLLFVGLMFTDLGTFSSNNQNIGTVGKKPISVQQYQIALTNRIRAFEAQVQQPIPFAQAQAFGIDVAARNELITARALDNAIDDMGVSIGDDRVRDEILQVPQFRGPSGDFDRQAYRGALARSGQTEAIFEQNIRDEAARALLQGAVVGGIPVPAAYADTLTLFIGEQREITWAAVDADDLTDPLPGATDADLQTYYDANPEDFTAPEKREITYAWLSPEMIQDTIEIDESTLRQAYEDRAEIFIRPERRLVERLIFSDDEAANAAIARVDAGEVTFDDLVAERGLDLSDADMGDVARSDLGDAADGVFAADPTQVVGPFPTDLGPALFRMNAVLAATETTFEQAAPDLREELSADQARRQIEVIGETINDRLAGGATLEELDETTDMELGTISFEANSFEGIAAYETFRLTASEVSEDDFPTLELLADGGIFALRLDSITPPAVRPFDEVTDAVRAAWTAQAERDAILAKAEEIATTITAQSNINDTGLLAITEPALIRSSFVEGTPPTFMSDVFEMAIGEVKVIPSTRNALIVRVESITPPVADDPQTTAQADSIGEAAAQGMSQDVFEAFATALQQQTDIDIDQAVLNAIHAQLP